MEKEVSPLFPTLHDPPPPPIPVQYKPAHLPTSPPNKQKVTYSITFPLVLLHTPTNFFFLIKILDTLGITSSPNYWTTETPKLILGYTTSANQLWWSIYSLDGEVGDLGFNVCFLFSFLFFAWLYTFFYAYMHMYPWNKVLMLIKRKPN